MAKLETLQQSHKSVRQHSSKDATASVNSIATIQGNESAKHRRGAIREFCESSIPGLGEAFWMF
jgi:hypothetical protein